MVGKVIWFICKNNTKVRAERRWCIGNVMEVMGKLGGIDA